MKRYPIWSYLSISAMDAPIISISWYLYFAQNSFDSSPNAKHCIILGVSVWLGYMADRLFDIRLKEEAQLISLRHRFCKEHEFKLWILWLIILAPISIFSIKNLNSEKLFACFILLAFIFIYNCLNQHFSRKGFPKEICVATLFSYGTLLLLENPLKIEGFMHLTLICFLNCLILTHKDRLIDNKMGVMSWSYSLSHKIITTITTLSVIYFAISLQGIKNPFFATTLVSLIIHSMGKKLNEEQFRVALESAFIMIPLLFVYKFNS